MVYSRRGYGESDAVPDVRGKGRLRPDYMHREALEVLPRLLEQLGIERPVLLGHSDGGSIALLHAAQFPVAACVVMAPHVIVEDVSIRSIEEARNAFEAGGLRERLARYHSDVDGAFWQWNDIWLDPAFRAFDIRPECRHITAPVLAIQGEDDPYGTLRQIDEIAPTLGAFEQRVLPKCGHSPQRDRPEETRRLVAEFLAALP
jgi:pimeloyl-ACP methyl ester carboxylesterase